MMGRYTVLALFCCFAAEGIGQPTLGPGSHNNLPGETYLLHRGQFFSPPPPDDANATFDRSSFAATSNFQGSFVAAPATAPPGTTVAEVASSGGLVFYKGTNASLEQMGFDVPQATMGCTDGVLMLSYPFTFQSTADAPTTCSGFTQGVPFERTGEALLTGRAWGTLVLPYGSISNVLVVRIHQYHTDYFPNSGDQTGYAAFMYLFYKPGVKLPLFSSYEIQQIPGPVTFYSTMLDESSVGVREAMRHDIGVDLMPNPASGSVEAVFGVVGGTWVTIELLDPNGRVVREFRRSVAASGVHREVLALDGVSSGMYVVRITDQDGGMGVKRLMVQ